VNLFTVFYWKDMYEKVILILSELNFTYLASYQKFSKSFQ